MKNSVGVKYIMMPWNVCREIDKILERQLPRFFSRKYFLLLVTNTINHLQFIIYRSVSSKITIAS